MSFNPANLTWITRFGSHEAGVYNRFTYVTSDTLTQVRDAHYFDSSGLRGGDLISVTASDGSIAGMYLAPNSGLLEL